MHTDFIKKYIDRYLLYVLSCILLSLHVATCMEGSTRLMLGDTDGYEFYKGDTDYGDAFYLDDILIRGRVEFCFDGVYSSVCTDGWDHMDASVVCRELGFSPYGKPALYYVYSQ